ncbi:MAG: MFS transporter [Cytophagales bacterium CG18_big_fil_WC_8_21_14_2_50_42_9]|nr:MAG: MFS transporter [Cytophagales bacterium CG18_big_fil_WC_8_21_14_2_50_42_9]
MEINNTISSVSTQKLNAYKPISKKTHRLAVGAIFFLQGLCFASWASRIPTIQQNLGLSESALGAVLLSLPVGLMLSLPLSGWLITKIGSRKVAVINALFYSLILVFLGFAQNTYQLIAGLFFYGLAGNMVNISINTQAVGVEALYKKSIMASFHGLWSLAGFIGAALGTIMIGSNFIPFYHFLVILVVAWLGVTLSAPYLIKEDKKGSENQPIFVKPDKSLINLGVIAFCSMICEGAMFDWSGVYFKKVVQAEPAWVGAGYTAFMCTMALSRFLADWLTSRFGLKAILQLSGILTAAGLIVAVLLPQLATAIIGFFLVGAGVSSVVPLVYGAAGKSEVLSPGVALAAVSTIGFLGFLVGPPLIGLVAGATSLRGSFSIIALMGLAITVVSRRSKF